MRAFRGFFVGLFVAISVSLTAQQLPMPFPGAPMWIVPSINTIPTANIGTINWTGTGTLNSLSCCYPASAYAQMAAISATNGGGNLSFMTKVLTQHAAEFDFWGGPIGGTGGASIMASALENHTYGTTGVPGNPVNALGQFAEWVNFGSGTFAQWCQTDQVDCTTTLGAGTKTYLFDFSLGSNSRIKAASLSASGVLCGTVSIALTCDPAGWGASLHLAIRDNSDVAGRPIFEVINGAADADNTAVGVFDFVYPANTVGSEVAQVFAYTSGTTATNRGGRLSFYTKVNNSTSVPEAVRITATQDLMLLQGATAGRARIGYSGGPRFASNEGSSSAQIILYRNSEAAGTCFDVATDGTLQLYSSNCSSVATLRAGLVQTTSTIAAGGLTAAGTVGTPVVVAYGNTVAATNTGTASIATVTPAVDTTYEVGCNVLVTTSTTHSFSCDVTYTDEGNTPRTLVLPVAQLTGTFVTSGLITNVTGAGPYESPTMTLRAKASTAVTVRTSAGGTFTTVVYNARGVIKQVS